MAKSSFTERARPRRQIPPTMVSMSGEESWNYAYGCARDLSSGGMLVQALRPKSVGEEFSVEFIVPYTDITVSCRGKVVWMRDKHPGSQPCPPQLGLKFIEIDPTVADRINDWATGRR